MSSVPCLAWINAESDFPERAALAHPFPTQEQLQTADVNSGPPADCAKLRCHYPLTKRLPLYWVLPHTFSNADKMLTCFFTPVTAVAKHWEYDLSPVIICIAQLRWSPKSKQLSRQLFLPMVFTVMTVYFASSTLFLRKPYRTPIFGGCSVGRTLQRVLCNDQFFKHDFMLEKEW